MGVIGINLRLVPDSPVLDSDLALEEGRNKEDDVALGVGIGVGVGGGVLLIMGIIAAVMWRRR